MSMSLKLNKPFFTQTIEMKALIDPSHCFYAFFEVCLCSGGAYLWQMRRKKDFNAMLNDSKDMPKFQIITDEKSINYSSHYFSNYNWKKVVKLPVNTIL